MKEFLSKIVKRAHDYLIMLQYALLSIRHGVFLSRVQDNTQNLQQDDIVLFCTLRNEAVRIPYFLDYYRRLDVGHFIFVDNGSQDGFRGIVKDAEDVSVWYASASYKQSNFGMHWLNYLMRKYGHERWCLVVDPDEFLVFPYCDKRNLKELTYFLDSEGKQSCFCLLLDMYSDLPVDAAHYESGQNPLEVCPYFDANGYVQSPQPFYGDLLVQGGPRRRLFFKDEPGRAPALNKIPLVKWRWTFSYIASTHIAMPRHLNRPHSPHHLSPTGCLLHFKFFSSFGEKAGEEIERGEHYGGSVEYRRYDAVVNTKSVSLLYEKSQRYRGWRQLEDLGLMNLGQWY